MRELIRKVLREAADWDWNSFDDLTPLPDGELKRYIIHSTSIDPFIIYNKGIKPFCSSESPQWSNFKYPCSVFAMNGYYEIWGQGNTKGAAVIDTTLLPNNKWWYDPGLYNEKNHEDTKIAIVTDKGIPADAIVGVLCVTDLAKMRNEYLRTKSDEKTIEYLHKIMRENAVDWSYDCEGKFDYEYRNM